MRNVTIESCSFDITTKLQKKAETADELVALDININDSDMFNAILDGLEKDFRLTDFLFFQSTQDNNTDYYKLLSDIKVYIGSPSFRMKYPVKKKKAYNVIENFKKQSSRSKRNKCH